MGKTNLTSTIFKRELKGYFNAPVAYVFLIVFLLLTGALTFFFGGLYERRVADLQRFFMWHPWVYLLLVPAATMGSWAEERRSGTIELLLTLPVSLWQCVVGKFLAAWAFIAIALALTFPVVATVTYLGDPDMGVIACGYLGSFLMAGAYVAAGMLASALTSSQVISFVVSLTGCFVLVVCGFPNVVLAMSQRLPAFFVNIMASLSFYRHFAQIQLGIVDLKDISYFVGMIIFMLLACMIVIDNRKSS